MESSNKKTMWKGCISIVFVAFIFMLIGWALRWLIHG